MPNDFAQSYSNAIGDIDNDGYPEIVVNNINHDNIFLWKNQTPKTNNWLKVKLEGILSNKNGIGSLIEVSVNGQQQYRYTLCGEGYLSQNSATEIIGLGTNDVVDYIKVKWLSETEDIFYNVESNQTLTIVEGTSLSLLENEIIALDYYPNPTRDILTINASNPINNVRGFNTIGQKVFEQSFNTSNVHLNLLNLKKGIYFLEIQLGNNRIETINIVKN